MSEQAQWVMKETGTVTVTKEGVSVQGFHFGWPEDEITSRQDAAETAIDWAIERLQRAKGGEW